MAVYTNQWETEAKNSTQPPRKTFYITSPFVGTDLW